MADQQWESAPLQPVLRLVHCIQKERGASCALVGSLAQLDASDDSFEDHQHESNIRLQSARTASNSAISHFYKSNLWSEFCSRNEKANLDIATMLFGVRQLVDKGSGDENEYLFFHDVIVECNSFLSSIIRVFVVNEIGKRKKDIQQKIGSREIEDKSKRKSKLALSLCNLILSFVTLKESLGMERATLSGLMAYGIELNDVKYEQTEVIEVHKSNNGARLNLVVNDLVMIVETQHQIMRDLKKQSGVDIRRLSSTFVDDDPEADNPLFDENYRTLLQQIGESVRPSDAMRSLQDHITKDFDIETFQQAMTMEEFWSGITVYMDRLHSMELFLLEELENCDGNFEDLDLLSLGIDTAGKESKQQPTTSVDRSDSANDSPALEEWGISLYDVEFLKRIGKGSAGTTYLGKYLKQDVALKVAATSELGLGGWTAELKSLKKLHHTNIIRFLGAIYNPCPVTYVLVLEYCDGGDLAVALNDVTPPNFFINVASGVANGMFYLHKMNYMHRDIKPSNVLLSGDMKHGHFVAKLTDFGLAVKVQNASVNNGKDLTAETGTYRYMAPEVIRHESYNFAADVYSFGLLMWEIITREKPFEPKSQIEAAGSVALEGKRPPFPMGIPLAVKELIEKCWAGKPGDRIEVEHIIKCLDELGNSMAASSWLASPTGYPVYRKQVVAKDKPEYGTPHDNGKMNKKKKSLLKNGLFRKKK
eukprot:CAMPEP_0181137074 /NCGR_PEP_ID=MMETSP1071-20121207/33517_1 /TAXON_ID=35127 /ORGANISM="Thalassiosira sp., Strain NH16" /LENGTH=705 /DNA_ID=CAMNT_0023223815 /DNA_START=158 /DNA_END=2278 /DNA_ORIENTATION=-